MAKSSKKSSKSSKAPPVYGSTVPIAPTNQLSPGLSDAQKNLQQQVASRGINQSQANFELERLKNLEQRTAPAVNSNLKLDTPSDVYNTGFAASKAGTSAGNLLTNPNQVNPFGTSNVSVDPITGQPTVKQDLSQPNQNIVGGLQGNSVTANSVLGGLLGGGLYGSLTNPAGANGPAPTSNYEDAVFQRLTHGLNDQKQRDSAQLTQTLAQRGIPVGSELYNDQIKQLNDRYDTQFQTAKGQAVELGTNSANNAISTLGQTGQAGFFSPQFQSFNPVQYNQVDTSQLFSTLQGTKLGMAQIGAQKDIAKMNAAAASEASQPPATTAFYAGTQPPGS